MPDFWHDSDAADLLESRLLRTPDLVPVFEKAGKVAGFPKVGVLIQGESGVGKEGVAKFIHAHSPRADKPYIPLDCGTFSSDLFASTLFGYRKGDFTGATQDEPGFLHTADGGTLFLDEIGNLSLEQQQRLLRVLQEGEFYRVGSRKSERVDVRIIAATNADLKEAVEKGGFREDLYYRLAKFKLTVPPLRERKNDILPLAGFLGKKFAQENGMECPPLSRDAAALLLSYSWPGNVRELENVMTQALIETSGEDVRAIGPECFSRLVTAEPSSPKTVITAPSHVEIYDRAGWNVIGSMILLFSPKPEESNPLHVLDEIRDEVCARLLKSALQEKKENRENTRYSIFTEIATELCSPENNLKNFILRRYVGHSKSRGVTINDLIGILLAEEKEPHRFELVVQQLHKACRTFPEVDALILEGKSAAIQMLVESGDFPTLPRLSRHLAVGESPVKAILRKTNPAVLGALLCQASAPASLEHH